MISRVVGANQSDLSGSGVLHIEQLEVNPLQDHLSPNR